MENSLKCSSDGCKEYVHAKGMCHKHYVSSRPKTNCAESGCNDFSIKRGKCWEHYSQGLERCLVTECTKPKRRASGMCERHDRNPSAKFKYSSAEERRAATLEKLRQRQQVTKDYIEKFKLDAGCTDCGYNKESCALDLDHLPQHEKICDVSRMLGWKMEKVLQEIAKCEVVCANCHRIRTKSRGFPI